MFTFLEGLLALGTIGFWFLVFIDFVVITALVEAESGIWATIVAIGSILGLNYIWKLPIAASIKAHPGHTALLILGYFVAGAVWSLIKWLIFLHKKNFAYSDFKAAFLEKNNAKELTPELAAKLMDSLTEKNRYENKEDAISSTPPSARDHYTKLTRWATYWPFSFVGTLLNDVVRKTWSYIIRLLQSTYQRMSNWVFREAVADTAMAEEFKAKKAAAGASSGGSSDADGESPSRRRGY